MTGEEKALLSVYFISYFTYTSSYVNFLILPFAFLSGCALFGANLGFATVAFNDKGFYSVLFFHSFCVS